jgi:GNAT superfamily N-acetyltransferase
MKYEIFPLSFDRLNDFLYFFDNIAFTDHKEWEGCYCIFYHVRAKEGESINRRDVAIDLIKRNKLCGYLAYFNGKVIGWCNTSDKASYPYILSEKILWDKDEINLKIKSIVCFTIDPAMRQKGVATQLLAKICLDAKVEGYDYIEGYPIKNENDYFGNYKGPLKLYQKSGFEPHKEIGNNYVYRKYIK